MVFTQNEPLQCARVAAGSPADYPRFAMSIREWFVWPSAVTLIALVAGCSSGSGGRCGGFNACGGDITGTWTVKSSCVEGNLTTAMNAGSNPVECRGDYKSVTAEVTGTVEFTSGTATDNTVTTIDYDLVPSNACRTALGVSTVDETNCAALAQAFVDGGHFGTTTCVVEGTACHCSAQNLYPKNEILTYSVSGSKVNYTTSTDNLDFCVAGSTLNARQFVTSLYTTVFFEATKTN
jgi:hypothetical protein